MADTQDKTSGFDFCFWAKLLVAIPVLPFVAIVAALQFTDPMIQAVAAVAAVIATVCLARAIDRVPGFSRSVSLKQWKR